MTYRKPMSEEQIEMWVERQTDALDAIMMTMSEEEYRTRLAAIDKRAEELYRGAM
jgi:hypothetical protein